MERVTARQLLLRLAVTEVAVVGEHSYAVVDRECERLTITCMHDTYRIDSVLGDYEYTAEEWCDESMHLVKKCTSELAQSLKTRLLLRVVSDNKDMEPRWRRRVNVWGYEFMLQRHEDHLHIMNQRYSELSVIVDV